MSASEARQKADQALEDADRSMAMYDNGDIYLGDCNTETEKLLQLQEHTIATIAQALISIAHRLDEIALLTKYPPR